MTQRSVLGVNSNIATRWLYCIECPQYSTRRRILYFKKIRSVCPSVSAMVSASINPLPSDRLRCCDRYIRCHRLLAVKPLEVQGNTRGGGWERAELLAAYRQSVIDPCPGCSPWSRVTVAARTGQWSLVDILFSKSNNYNNT